MKNKNDEKKHKVFIKKYRYKSKVLVVLIFVIFLLSKLSVFNCLGFIGMNEAKLIIKEFEKCYLYNDVFKDEKYIETKNKLFIKGFTTKAKIYDLISEAKELAKDNTTEFRYVNFLQGKFSHSFSKGSPIKRKHLNIDTIYIRLDNFHEGTAHKFSKILEKEDAMNSLVLDLRGNNMGSYIEAIQIADDLLPEGNIIAQIECSNSKHLYCSNPFHYNFDKVYILVDNESGYCTEIIALALKENLKDKVMIIGNETMKMKVGFVLKEYNSKIAINIAHLNWNVKGKSAADLSKHIYNYNDIESKDKNDNVSLEKIMEIIKQ
ncbi:MAG: S41 family peptidase [Firmicutes bacterium]|nr:S41 family peptidase [Bacillota bacterium]